MAEESDTGEQSGDGVSAENQPSKPGKGRRSRTKKRSAKRADGARKRGNAGSQGAGGRPAEPSGQPDHSDEAWQPLVSLTVGVETFCKEAIHFADAWPHDESISENKRSKAVRDVVRLIKHGEALSKAVVHWLYRRGRQPSGPAFKQLRSAWRRLQSIDLAQRIQRVLGVLVGIRDRLDKQFTPEVQQQINQDFRALTAEIERLNRAAATVRQSLHRTCDSTLSSTLKTNVSRLIEAITTAITGSVRGTSDTWLDRDRFAVQLPERIKRARAVRDAYQRLVDALQSDFADRVKAMARGEERAAEKLDSLLEDVEQVIMTVGSTEEFARTTEEAASLGIDYIVSREAVELQKELHRLRLDFTALESLISQHREILARAPFKRVSPSRPLPTWPRLPEDFQRILAVLIEERFDSQHAAMYSMSRKAIEEKLGCGSNDATLNRRLAALDEEYEIVGKYQPLRCAEDQRPGCGYWIEEYAYLLYGSEVLGQAWIDPSER